MVSIIESKVRGWAGVMLFIEPNSRIYQDRLARGGFDLLLGWYYHEGMEKLPEEKMDREATDEEIVHATEISRKAGDIWLHERLKEAIKDVEDGEDEDERVEPEQKAKIIKEIKIIKGKEKNQDELVDKLAKNKDARNALN